MSFHRISDHTEVGATRAFTEAHGFTFRETKILQLLLSGTGDAGIARELQISEIAVKSGCRKIMHKLGVSNRDEVVQKAKQWELAVSRLLG